MGWQLPVAVLAQAPICFLQRPVLPDRSSILGSFNCLQAEGPQWSLQFLVWFSVLHFLCSILYFSLSSHLSGNLNIHKYSDLWIDSHFLYNCMFILVKYIFLYMDLHCLCWQVELSPCSCWAYLAYFGFSRSCLILNIDQLFLTIMNIWRGIGRREPHRVKLLLKYSLVLLAYWVLSLLIAFSYLSLYFIPSLPLLLLPAHVLCYPVAGSFCFTSYYPPPFLMALVIEPVTLCIFHKHYTTELHSPAYFYYF